MLPKQLKDSQRHQRQSKQVELFLQSSTPTWTRCHRLRGIAWRPPLGPPTSPWTSTSYKRWWGPGCKWIRTHRWKSSASGHCWKGFIPLVWSWTTTPRWCCYCPPFLMNGTASPLCIVRTWPGLGHRLMVSILLLCKNNSTCFGCLWCLWLSLSCFGSIWLDVKIWKNAEKS